MASTTTSGLVEPVLGLTAVESGPQSFSVLRSFWEEIGGRVRLELVPRDRKVSLNDRPRAAEMPALDIATIGMYLTNEVFLYRVHGLIAGTDGEMVELEDCYGLDVVHVPLRDLHAGRLRVVTPASTGDSLKSSHLRKPAALGQLRSD